ncbi:TetR/AcrR family transcriptional regulator [Chitinophaga skermanii]|nr:TetR/AcrR family transcriptional regulator [Chitinophaga skermanii]
MRDRIIEAALKRFTHFSASKTTMNEIAEDLHCSKASLYYYFPDKNAVHIAVLAKIGESYLQTLEKEANNSEVSAGESLMNTIKIRNNFMTRFCRLEIFKLMRQASFEAMNNEVKAAKKREWDLMTRIIERGIESGEFVAVADPQELAGILFHALMGMRLAFMDHPQQFTEELSDAQLADLEMKQELLLSIFVKGLKKN